MKKMLLVSLGLVLVLLLAGGVAAASCITPKGANFKNVALCSNDGSGLTNNVEKSIVQSCTIAKKCEYTCNRGYGNCNNLLSDGCEVTNLKTNKNNCGSCGTVCSGTTDSCVNSVCKCGKNNACPTGQTCTNGRCVKGCTATDWTKTWGECIVKEKTVVKQCGEGTQTEVVTKTSTTCTDESGKPTADTRACIKSCTENKVCDNKMCKNVCTSTSWNPVRWSTTCTLPAGKTCGAGTKKGTVSMKSNANCAGEDGKPILSQACTKNCASGSCNAAGQCVRLCRATDWVGTCVPDGSNCKGKYTYSKKQGVICEGGVTKANNVDVCNIGAGYDIITTCVDTDGGSNIFAPGTVTFSFLDCKNYRRTAVVSSLTEKDMYNVGLQKIYERSCPEAASIIGHTEVSEREIAIPYTAIACSSPLSAITKEGEPAYCTGCSGSFENAQLCDYTISGKTVKGDVGVSASTNPDIVLTCIRNTKKCAYQCNSGFVGITALEGAEGWQKGCYACNTPICVHRNGVVKLAEGTECSSFGEDWLESGEEVRGFGCQ